MKLTMAAGVEPGLLVGDGVCRGTELSAKSAEPLGFKLLLGFMGQF